MAFAVLPAIVFTLASCGGDSGSSEKEKFAAKEVVAAFEDAAGGYEFEKTVTLVEGAVAYAPKSDADPTVVEPLNEALGEGSVLWQVLIFEGPDPPLGEEAAKEAAFASDTFKEEGDGIYIGDSGIAYAANENVVINGPALNGDPEDETLKRWKAVLDGL